MTLTKYISTAATRIGLGLALCVGLFVTTAVAQTGRPLTWEQDLTYLEKLSPAEAAAQQGAIKQIRHEVEQWLLAHPNSGITLAPLSDKATSQQEVQTLHAVVEQIVKKDPAHPFHLGQTEVNVTATVSVISPTVDTVDQTQIQQNNSINVAKALSDLPGVQISNLSGKRNEASFMVRGYSSNGQVPLYQDGIPMYVPYDGYLDINRFLTSDLAEIEVAKGYSSPLLGPNALGGSVNLVTREPVRKYEGDALIGTYSGNGLLASLNLGTRQRKYFLQGGVDWAQADYIPLSGNLKYPAGGYTALKTSPNVPYALNDEMNNSYSRDERFSGRAGWTPRAGDQYVFSYINQKGQKGSPLYMGSNAAASFKAFWKWPRWDKTSYYFIGNTGLSEKTSLKTRIFYDQFQNGIDMYDNSKYTTMSSYSYNAKTGYSGSEVSRYNDHTDGISAELNSHSIKRNDFGISFFFKDDTHRENGIYGPTSSTPVVIPDKVLRDQVTSIGLQDSITITSRLRGTLGFSSDHINGRQASTYGTGATITVIPYKCDSEPGNTSFNGCTAHYWNNNWQGALTYTLTQSSNLFLTFADRGRFPTLKQRYSSGMGSALPNPDLKGENARNWNLGYAKTFSTNLSAQVELFRSDLRNAIENGIVADPGVTQTATVISPAPTTLMCPNNTTHTTTSYYNCSMGINIGKETHQGVEFQFHARPIPRVMLDGSYSYLSRNIGSATAPTGTAISGTLALSNGIPKHAVVGKATVLLPYHITGVAIARFNGGITLQNASSVNYTSQFATLDLGATVPVRDRFSAQVGIKNVFDRNYYFTDGYPETGRNWYLNLRYRY